MQNTSCSVSVAINARDDSRACPVEILDCDSQTNQGIELVHVLF